MKPKKPFLFIDFRQAVEHIIAALQAKVAYILLTGESRAGKTMLLEELERRLDSCSFRVVYLCLSNLTPPGVIRVLARRLRIPTRRTLAETSQNIAAVLSNEPGLTLLWLDEAHSIADETFDLLRTLAESRLGRKTYLSVLLAGLPSLRSRLQAPHLLPLWRRIRRRIEITGLRSDEARPFLRHAFRKKEVQRIDDTALSIIFEHSRGLPGNFEDYADVILRQQPKGTIDAETAQAIIQQWDLP